MGFERIRQRSIGFVLGAIALAGSIGALPSLAQDAAQPAQPGAAASPDGPGWQKFCNEHPQTKQQICVVTRQMRVATGQSIAAFSVREAGGKYQFVAAVPPGMQLRPGMQVEIDGGNTQRTTFTVCIPEFCFADADLTDDYIAALKRGNELVITAVGQDGRPVDFPISLSGFTASFDGAALRIQDRDVAAGQLQDELSKRASEVREELIRRQQELGK